MFTIWVLLSRPNSCLALNAFLDLGKKPLAKREIPWNWVLLSSADNCLAIFSSLARLANSSTKDSSPFTIDPPLSKPDESNASPFLAFSIIRIMPSFISINNSYTNLNFFKSPFEIIFNKTKRCI